MLHIYTETFRPWAKFKRIIKNIIGKSLGGPKAVELSLFLGLKELNAEFVWNKESETQQGIAYVLSGVETLKWAIEKKRQGVFKHLIVGPNIVVTPFEQNNLILSPEIDLFLVPAQWSIDWWSSLVPEFNKKLKVWSAGVKDLGSMVNPTGKILIFQKNASAELLDFIEKELSSLGEKYQLINYGSFNQAEYFKFLSQSRLMIYLSQSESQGLALHEAWMAGVPSLIWDRGYMEYKNFKWQTKNISAPYLTENCGLNFKGMEDFGDRFKDISSNIKKFNPREYSQQNFTNKRTAEKFLEIIKKL